jgi:hypothetical protein
LSCACTALALSANAAAKMPDKTCFIEKDLPYRAVL